MNITVPARRWTLVELNQNQLGVALGDRGNLFSIPWAVEVSQTTFNTCLALRYPYQRFTYASLSALLPQTLFMFCRAAGCPPFGAILPCHFISDSISSALLLLKGGGGRVVVVVVPAAQAWWFIIAGCSAVAPYSSNFVAWTGRTGLLSCGLNSSLVLFVSALISTLAPAPNIQYTSKKAKHTFDIRLHAHTRKKHLRRASVPYVGECIRCETNYHRWLN